MEDLKFTKKQILALKFLYENYNQEDALTLLKEIFYAGKIYIILQNLLDEGHFIIEKNNDENPESNIKMRAGYWEFLDHIFKEYKK